MPSAGFCFDGLISFPCSVTRSHGSAGCVSSMGYCFCSLFVGVFKIRVKLRVDVLLRSNFFLTLINWAISTSKVALILIFFLKSQKIRVRFIIAKWISNDFFPLPVVISYRKISTNWI